MNDQPEQISADRKNFLGNIDNPVQNGRFIRFLNICFNLMEVNINPLI